jgi:hypothetical protein
MINNTEALIDDLRACKKAFDAVGVPWSITDGIVLGYARYKNVMAWDDDVDTGVFVELSDKEWRDVFESLRRHGFNVNCHGLQHGKKRDDFIYGHRKTGFGVGFFHKIDGYYEARPESTPGVKFLEKASWHDDHLILDFLGDVFPFPNNIDDYLSCRYGTDYMTNIIKNPGEFFEDRRGGNSPESWKHGPSGKNGVMWPKILDVDDTMEVYYV